MADRPARSQRPAPVGGFAHSTGGVNVRGWLRIPLVASVSMDDQHRGRSGIEHLVADAAQDKGTNLAAAPAGKKART